MIGGFVKNQHPRPACQGTGNGDALALSPRQQFSALADKRLIPARKALDELIGRGHARGRRNALGGKIGISIRDVLEDGPGKDDGILHDHAHLPPEISQIHVTVWMAVGAELAVLRAVEAEDEIDDRALARPIGANDREGRSRPQREADIVQNRLILVVKRHRFQGNLPLERNPRTPGIRRLVFGPEDIEHRGERLVAGNDQRDGAPDRLQVGSKQAERHVKRQQLSQRHGSSRHRQSADDQDDDPRGDDRRILKQAEGSAQPSHRRAGELQVLEMFLLSVQLEPFAGLDPRQVHHLQDE